MRFPSLSAGLRALGSLVGVKSGGMPQTFQDLLGGGGSRNGDLNQPYRRSAWVRSAISFVATPIAARPLTFTLDRRGGDTVLDDPALTAFWEMPALTRGGVMSRSDFLEATVGWLKLKGQAFWIMDDSWLAPRGKRNPLILARPDEMHAVKDGSGLLGWTWTGGAGQRHALIPDQVIHLKFWNPYDDVLGLSEWEAALVAAESDYAAGTFARNLAKNNGDRGPYVIGKSGQYSDEQIKQVSAQLRAKRELGRRGEFRAVFIPADVEVKEPTVNSVDAAYVAQRLENRKEVYIAFGVPPSFADPQASYSIGSASDRFRLIEDTCMPLATKLADAMEIVSKRFRGKTETIFVEFDWDSHSTMQAVRAERFDTATKAVDKGMPWKTAGEYFRLKLPRFPGDTVGRIPFNLQEIEGPADNTPPPAPESDPVADLGKLFAARSQARCKAGAGIRKGTSAIAAAKWAKIHKAREPWERKYKQKVSRFLMDARAETLRKLDAAAKAKGLVTKDETLSALDIVFDLSAWLEKWAPGLLDVSRNAMETAGAEVWKDELFRDDPLTMPAAEVLQALANRENRLRGAGEQIWQAVVSELEDGITRGETTDQLAERIRRKFAGIDKSRGIVIAKTETTVAYETARDIAFRAAGVQWKQWLCSGLGNERPSHLEANEQIVEVSEKFSVGGFDMAFPGDPDGPPQEVINCNCVSIAVAGPDGGDIEGNDGENIPY